MWHVPRFDAWNGDFAADPFERFFRFSFKKELSIFVVRFECNPQKFEQRIGKNMVYVCNNELKERIFGPIDSFASLGMTGHRPS